MNNMRRALSLVIVLVMVAALGAPAGAQRETQEARGPRYIFLFIGDGMSYPQIQAASYYMGAMASGGQVQPQPLTFMDFPATGSCQTYDSTSFAPDSSSTATAIATGNKTWSGTLNMDTTLTQRFETISEKLFRQQGYKIGVVTTMNLNHATPAAFYAHQPSRQNFYEIGLELIESDFDYFAGGALLKPNGESGLRWGLYSLAERAGYTIVSTQAEAEALRAGDQKVIIVGEALDRSDDSLNYSMDAAPGEWQLADYVTKGIELLDNETGFFMAIEGGKIDMACHANDAAAAIHDTVALSDAVDVAVAFYEAHPDDTLIVVTGDHETGGFGMGYAGTDYDTYLTSLENQKISATKFHLDYASRYKASGTSFEDALGDIEACFGLKVAGDEDDRLVLTEYELGLLRAAYDRTMTVGVGSKDDMTQAEYLLYGTYDPLSVTITHLLNNKSGIAFTSYKHTGLPTAVFALGAGSELFEGYYDNTDIFAKLKQLTGVE